VLAQEGKSDVRSGCSRPTRLPDALAAPRPAHAPLPFRARRATPRARRAPSRRENHTDDRTPHGAPPSRLTHEACPRHAAAGRLAEPPLGRRPAVAGAASLPVYGAPHGLGPPLRVLLCVRIVCAPGVVMDTSLRSTAVLPKIPHPNFCKRVPSRPLRVVEADFKLVYNCWSAGFLRERLYIHALYPYPLRIRAEHAYPESTVRKRGEDISVLSAKNCEIISNLYLSYESQITGIYKNIKLLAPAEFRKNSVDLSFHVPTIMGFMCKHLAAASGVPARPGRNRSITRLGPRALSARCDSRFRMVLLTTVYKNCGEPHGRRPFWRTHQMRMSRHT